MLERWNPTVKAFTVLICVILLSFEYLVSLNLLVLAVCLLLLMFCSRVSLKKIGVILLPACIAAFGLFVMGLYYARGGSTQTMDLSSLSAMPYSVRAAMSQNLYTALQLATRLLAYAGHPVCTFHRGGLLHCQPAAPVPPPAQVCLWHPGGVPPDAGDGAGVRPGAHGLCGARPEGGPALDEAGLHHAGQQRPLVGVHRHGHGVQGLLRGGTAYLLYSAPGALVRLGRCCAYGGRRGAWNAVSKALRWVSTTRLFK